MTTPRANTLAARQSRRLIELYQQTRWILIIAAVGILAWRWWSIVSAGIELDAGAYWWADPLDPYGSTQVATSRAYLYSPAFAQALAPLTALPWTAFHAIWTAINIGALAFLVGPVWAAVAIFLPPVHDEVLIGNIHLLLAAALVLAFRYPAVMAFPLLTKVTPGVGLVWFAVRRQWRDLGLALAATAAVVGLSVLLGPHLWAEWLSIAAANSAERVDVALIPLPIGLRVAFAVAIIAAAAAMDRSWLVPFGVFVALPVVWFPSLSLLLASFPLIRADAQRRRSELRKDVSSPPRRVAV